MYVTLNGMLGATRGRMAKRQQMQTIPVNKQAGYANKFAIAFGQALMHPKLEKPIWRPIKQGLTNQLTVLKHVGDNLIGDLVLLTWH